MARLLTVLVFSVLFARPGLSMGAVAEQSPAVDSLRVKASGPGRLFFGGNVIEGPWLLSYETGRLTVNGYGIAPPKPAPAVKGTPEKAGELAFLNRLGALADSLARSGTEPGRATEIFIAFCIPNPWGVTILKAAPGSVEVRMSDGARIGFSLRLGSLMQPLPPNERQSRTASRLRSMILIRNMLARGGVLFLDGRVSQTYIQPWYTECVLAAVAKLRSGAMLDSAENRCLPFEARHQVQIPATLARYPTSR